MDEYEPIPDCYFRNDSYYSDLSAVAWMSLGMLVDLEWHGGEWLIWGGPLDDAKQEEALLSIMGCLDAPVGDFV